LIAGLYEMHSHLGQNEACSYCRRITTVRDMGNDNAVLDQLIEQIDSGASAAPT